MIVLLKYPTLKHDRAALTAAMRPFSVGAVVRKLNNKLVVPVRAEDFGKALACGPVFASAPLPFNGRAMSVQDHDAQIAKLESEIERLNDDIFDLHQQIANLCE